MTIEDKRDYIHLSRANIFGDKDSKERLVLAIKEGITKFEYLEVEPGLCEFITLRQ